MPVRHALAALLIGCARNSRQCAGRAEPDRQESRSARRRRGDRCNQELQLRRPDDLLRRLRADLQGNARATRAAVRDPRRPRAPGPRPRPVPMTATARGRSIRFKAARTPRRMSADEARATGGQRADRRSAARFAQRRQPGSLSRPRGFRRNARLQAQGHAEGRRRVHLLARPRHLSRDQGRRDAADPRRRSRPPRPSLAIMRRSPASISRCRSKAGAQGQPNQRQRTIIASGTANAPVDAAFFAEPGGPAHSGEGLRRAARRLEQAEGKAGQRSRGAAKRPTANPPTPPKGK